jgi:hypothetical protein
MILGPSFRYQHRSHLASPIFWARLSRYVGGRVIFVVAGVGPDSTGARLFGDGGGMGRGCPGPDRCAAASVKGHHTAMLSHKCARIAGCRRAHKREYSNRAQPGSACGWE